MKNKDTGQICNFRERLKKIDFFIVGEYVVKKEALFKVYRWWVGVAPNILVFYGTFLDQ